MKLGIGLISCDRVEETVRTIESFALHNTRGNPLDVPGEHVVQLFHADDSSKDPYIRRTAANHGFELITKIHEPRQGGQAMRRQFIAAAKTAGCTHILVLENDWESVRPLPWDAIGFAFSFEQIFCMRLYGVYRERDPVTGLGRRACGKTHYGKGKGIHDPNWQKVMVPKTNEMLEFGDIHWGAPPNITRIAEAVWLHDGTKSEGAIIKKSAKIGPLLSARVVDNVFYHIGYDRTPGFKA
jgi:hypothetical protein